MPDRLKSFPDLPAAVRALWAKSDSGPESSRHGLLAHMLDVAAVAEVLLERESHWTVSWIARCFGLPERATARWIGALVGLHDFGKAIPGFQCKWAEGQAADESAGLPFKPAALRVDRHDFAGTGLLRRVLSSRFPGAAWIVPVTQALGAHHGYMPTSQTLPGAVPGFEGQPWSEARDVLFDAYWATLEPAGMPTVAEVGLPAIAWLAGLTSVSDWIGSNQNWLPPGERDASLAAHHVQALALARRALDIIGWPVFRPLAAGVVDASAETGRIIGRPGTIARPLQSTGIRLLDDVREPALLLVEAPMGEGKTELAFLAHLRLQAVNGHRGLYVALPTQSTGNAMFERAVAFLDAYGGDARLDIQLVHGAASINEHIHRLRDIDASAKESVQSSAWFARSRRPLLSPYGAGTIDQALLATLNVKHHFVRLWGLANRVVVLDEVHAYDTYTGGLIEALLRWLKAMNCSVVLMSATLPDRRRAALLEAWGAPPAPEVEYPRILVSHGGTTRGEHVPARALAPIHVTPIPEDLTGIAEAALDAVAGGGCGAVILNTVQRAQNLYSLLQGRVGGDTRLLLFHARFPADERGAREAAVLSAFGPGAGEGRPERALLVATQVVEQSLDVDFDFMLTDLAPMDLLLQRAGRLHRHARTRPEKHENPRLTVAGLMPDREPDLERTAWAYVYDPYILYRTWQIASRESMWCLPQDIDRLVQAVYASGLLDDVDRDEFQRKLDRALGEHLADVQYARRLSINAAIDADAAPQDGYLNKPQANEEGDGGRLHVATRLGEESVLVVPVFETPDGWVTAPGQMPFDPQAPMSDPLAHHLYLRQVRLTRKAVVKSLSQVSAPVAFETHPLLRHLKPLLLRDGAISFGKLRVRLDSDLGVVYETTEGA